MIINYHFTVLIYLSLVLIIPVLYGVFLKNEHRDRIILITVCSLMFIMLSLRKPFSDVAVYRDIYGSLKGISFSEMMKDFHFIKVSSITGVEWGYSFMCWILTKIGIPFQIFLVLESAFCVFCIYHFIDKNSVNFPLSIALIIGLGLFDYLFIIIRQTMAFGFLLLAFEQMQKRNIPLFAVLVAVAVMMHRTAMLFVVVFPLSYLRVTKISVAVFSCASFLIIPLYPLFERLFIRKAFSFMFKDGYLGDSGFEFKKLIIIILAIIVFLMVFSRQKEDQDEKDKAAFWAFMLSLPIQVTACYVPILGRVSTLMYLPFAAAVIPNYMETNENKRLVRIFEILVFAAVLAYYAFCLIYDRRELELIPYRLFFMD